jgi:aspartate/methionine/tyrosine aminotransferase
MSKTYGLAGLRIGWIATRNSTIFNEMAAFKDYTSICNSAPSEYLSLIGTAQSTETHRPKPWNRSGKHGRYEPILCCLP